MLGIKGIAVLFPTLVFSEEQKVFMKITLPKQAVMGLPLPIELQVRGPIKMVEPRLNFDQNPFVLTLTKGEHQVSFPIQDRFRMPNPRRGIIYIDRNSEPRYIRRPSSHLYVKIKDGNTASFTFDLSVLAAHYGNFVFHIAGTPHEKLLPSGEYMFRISKDDTETNILSEKIKFLKPNRAEQALLKQLTTISDGNKAGERIGTTPLWSTYVLFYPSIKKYNDLKKISSMGAKQLAYYSVLSSLVHNPKPLKELTFDDKWLEQALPAYRLDLLALRFEIESERGDQKAAARTRTAILSRSPHYGRVLDSITKNKGYISIYRKHVQKLKSK